MFHINLLWLNPSKYGHARCHLKAMRELLDWNYIGLILGSELVFEFGNVFSVWVYKWKNPWCHFDSGQSLFSLTANHFPTCNQQIHSLELLRNSRSFGWCWVILNCIITQHFTWLLWGISFIYLFANLFHVFTHCLMPSVRIYTVNSIISKEKCVKCKDVSKFWLPAKKC